MDRPLILIGGGGHCKSVIEAAESKGQPIAGILDLPATVGREICGHRVIGTDDDISQYVGDHDFIVTVGYVRNPALRLRIIGKVEAAGGIFGTVVASSAKVSPHALVSEGTVVLHGACVNAGARIGRNCIVNTLSDVEHDVILGDNVHVSTGAMVNGDARVGTDTFIGSGSVVANGVGICPGCVIGAGCVVIGDIDTPGIYVGVPARKTGDGKG